MEDDADDEDDLGDDREDDLEDDLDDDLEDDLDDDPDDDDDDLEDDDDELEDALEDDLDDDLATPKCCLIYSVKRLINQQMQAIMGRICSAAVSALAQQRFGCSTTPHHGSTFGFPRCFG